MNKTLLAIALFGLAAGETSAQQIGRAEDGAEEIDAWLAWSRCATRSVTGA